MISWVTIIQILSFMGLVIFPFILIDSLILEKLSDHSLDWHRRNGKYRVLYDDGNISQPFSHKVACDYAEIFGGKVIRKDTHKQK